MIRKSIHRHFAAHPPRTQTAASAAFAPLPEPLRATASAGQLQAIYALARQQAEEQVARQRELRRDVSRWN